MSRHTAVRITVRTTPRTKPVEWEWGYVFDTGEFTPQQMMVLEMGFAAITSAMAEVPGKIELRIKQGELFRP